MAEIKKLVGIEFSDIASKLPFAKRILTKDYYITIILYLLKDINGIYFKGGTAIQKIILNHARISEDVDFTITADIEETKKNINEILHKSNFFERITKDKDVEGFTRIIVHYKGFEGEEGYVFIDLNKRAALLSKPEKHIIKHFYQESIPEFSFNTLAKEEMIAEKMAAAIGRNKPRDHYDLYKIIKKGIPINLELVKQGFAYSYSYPPDIKYQDQFVKAQQEAREAKRGLWNACLDDSRVSTPSVSPSTTPARLRTERNSTVPTTGGSLRSSLFPVSFAAGRKGSPR